MKRVLSLFLIIALLCALTPTVAVADDEWIEVPGIEGGLVQFDERSGTILRVEPTVTRAEIPDRIGFRTVNRIGEGAFASCTELTEVVMAETIIEIKNVAFRDCVNLKTVRFPELMRYIGSGAFMGCTSLTDIELPNDLYNIYGGAFSGCTSLTKIHIPRWPEEMESGVFEGCTGITEFTVDSVNRYFHAEDGVLFFDDWLYQYPLGKAGTTYEIPAGVGYLYGRPFSYAPYLTQITVAPGNASFSSVDGVLFDKERTTLVCYPAARTASTYVIPEGITAVESGAFLGCKDLKKIVLPSTMTRISLFAFNGLTCLREITIPESVTAIGECAFQSCSGLTDVTISDSVTKIERSAFAFCGSLRDVWYTGSEEQWETITIGENNDALRNARIHYDRKDSTLGDNDEFTWSYRSMSGEVEITEGELPENDTIFVAVLNEDGRITGVKCITKEQLSVQVGTQPGSLKLFWLDGDLVPRATPADMDI